MFLYIIRPIGIRVKICDYVNQNTAHSRGIDLSERTVLEMSVITKAGLLALAAVLLLPSAQTTQAAQPEPLIVIVQKRQDAQERTLRVLRDGSVEEAALDTYLAQVVLSEMRAGGTQGAGGGSAHVRLTADGGRQARKRGRVRAERLLPGVPDGRGPARAVWRRL